MLPFLLPPVLDLQFRIFSSPVSQEGANCIISTTRVLLWRCLARERQHQWKRSMIESIMDLCGQDQGELMRPGGNVYYLHKP